MTPNSGPRRDVTYQTAFKHLRDFKMHGKIMSCSLPFRYEITGRAKKAPSNPLPPSA